MTTHITAFADRPKIEQMIFGHPAKDNPFANKLEQQAKAKVDGIEEFTRDFLDDLLRISQTILRGLAVALGQPENFFIEASSKLLLINALLHPVAKAYLRSISTSIIPRL